MNLFLFLLLIPLSFAASPPGCGELGTILQDYEKDLQKATMQGCNNLNHQDLIQGIPVTDSEFLNGKVCQDLGTIEAQLEQLKIEEGVLLGIAKLKATVQENQENASSGNTQVARVAARKFVDSLDMAQSMELLLHSAVGDTPIIRSLKEVPPNELLNQNDLSLRISELCKDENKTEQNVCNPNLFQPGPEAASEIIEMIKNANPTDDQIQSWQGMIAIQRKNATEEDEPYSFNIMKQELGSAFASLDSNSVLTKDQLKAIQKLDQFQNAPGFSFVEDIIALKDIKKEKIASDKFFLLMGDAKLRQQYEVQSKISVAWENHKESLNSLSDEKKADCAAAAQIYTKARSCLAHMRAGNGSVGSQNLDDFLDAVESSINYADQLAERETGCGNELRDKGKLTLLCYDEMNKDLAEVQDKILQLNLMKERIGKENLEKMKFRNYALNKWGTQNCGKVESSMDMCEESASITKEALLTVSDSMKISILFAPKPEVDAEVEAICDEKEEDELKTKEKRLCDFFNDTTSDIIVTNNVPTHPDGPTEAPDGEHNKAILRDGLIENGSKMLSDVLRSLMPRTNPPMGVNPYPYNFNPYNNGTPPLGIADTIMFNARYQGAYGFYMPTPGLQPHTAFGPNVSFTGYKSVSSSPSRYFSF